MENRHAIRKQELRVSVDSEEMALALHSRMAEINQRYFVPVIEAVLNQMAPPARHVQIARLKINLGSVPLAALAETGSQRLQYELRRALEEILSRPEESGDAGFHSQSPDASRLELFEHYLVHGTLPFWAPSPDAASLEELALKLAEGHPGELASVLRECGPHKHALERLVRQFADPLLQRLLHVLEPGHAALIIAYIFDLREIHRVKRDLALGERDFSRLVWLLVFAYLVQDRGSRFNRKSFVKSVLQGMGQAEGLAYEEIIAILCLGLEKTGERLKLNSSLPGIIKELALEIETHRAEPESSSGLQAYSGDGQESPDSTIVSVDSVRQKPPLGDMLSRYKMIETLRYILRFGVLPWTMLIRSGEQDAAAFVALLPGLPGFDLHLVFRAAPLARRRMVWHAVQALPEESVTQILSHLLYRGNEMQHFLLESLPDFASRSEDRSTFYSRLMVAVLENSELDLETFAAGRTQEAETGSLLLPQSPVAWRPQELKSVLLGQMQSGDTGTHDGFHAEHDILRVLIHHHPREALHFFSVLRRRKRLLERLVRHCPCDLVLPILELTRPGEAGMLDSILQSAFTIPVPYRPGSDQDRRQAILLEALRLEKGEEAGEAFFRRVLSRLFDVPLSDRVRQRLLETSAGWRASNYASLTLITAFETVVAAMSAPPAVALAQGVDHGEEAAGHSGTVLVPQFSPQALFAFLSGADPEIFLGTTEPGGWNDMLDHELLVRIEQSGDQVCEFFQRNGGDPRLRRQWITVLGESCLARVAHIMEPQKCHALLETAELLVAAWFETTSHANLPGDRHEVLWDFLLAFLAHKSDANRSTAALTESFFEYVSENSGNQTSAAALLETATRLAETAGRANLAAVFQPDGQQAVSPTAAKEENRLKKPAKRASAMHKPYRRPVQGKTAFGMTEDQEELGDDPIYISNAGLVLASPFFPHLFRSLDMLEDTGNERARLRPGETASRAVHLLQYLVDSSVSTAEPLLVLNKILCGLDAHNPVDSRIEMLDHERQLCDQLLQAVISKWEAITNTSVAGLRETFLQRNGKIQYLQNNGHWKLTVQRKTVDVLVDQLPWSISVIYHRWMATPVYVTW